MRRRGGDGRNALRVWPGESLLNLVHGQRVACGLQVAGGVFDPDRYAETAHGGTKTAARLVITLFGLLAAGDCEHDVRQTTRPGIVGPLGRRPSHDFSLTGHRPRLSCRQETGPAPEQRRTAAG